MEKVRCMLSNANLPKSFWSETASTACFLINRSPFVAIEKKTPQEVWSSNPADYSDLKIFRCPLYAHVDNGKLELRSIKCVFLGYKAGVKGARREIKPLKNYAEANLVAYALNVAKDIDANQEPSNYSEAISCEDSEKWMFTMQEEMESLHKNRTWDLVKLPKDVFSPVVKHSLIRALLGIVAMHDLELEGFYSLRKRGLCLLAEKIPLQFETVTKKMVQERKIKEIRKVEAQLSEEFEMKDLGPAKKILGMEILRDRKESKLYLSQKGYIEKVLCRFTIQSAKPVSTPLATHFRLSSALSPQSDDEIKHMSHVPYSSVVGSLMYAMFERTCDGVIGYVDVDFARDLDRRRSLTGYVFTIGGCAISWKATLQTTVALSTLKLSIWRLLRLVKKLFG
ncbi:hypothetical protein CXB51_004866 [Gossypium anomalum]|uniref:Reverse transcriptase Ty1/copia-type domain-containing protein n=1 Tax=Gossypium anomalum TaxID=47600 RepID=A0A8J6D830_9ROSI|nr:hypothetical protein CXB51_004866 [Gossypium anomalum]